MSVAIEASNIYIIIMNEALKKLRELALTLRIEPEDSLEKAASLDTIIKVFSDVKRSFTGFVEVEFLKDETYKKFFEKNPHVLKDLQKDLQLFIVDVKFSSFQASLAPNLVELQNPLFKDEVLEWKRQKFDAYKSNVFLANYHDAGFVRAIVRTYTPEERAKIYRPAFDALSGNHKINVLDRSERVVNVLTMPDELRRVQIIPPITQTKPPPIEKNVVGYFKVLTDGTSIELKKSRIKQVYDMEVLEHDTYPFKPDTIRFDDRAFVLNQKLICQVDYRDEMYFISYSDLDISVWGTTRDEVEEAFAFTFSALYDNYFLENDQKLSPKAQDIKHKLASLIRSTLNENSESKRH